jgi:hypothetical protein
MSHWFVCYRSIPMAMVRIDQLRTWPEFERRREGPQNRSLPLSWKPRAISGTRAPDRGAWNGGRHERLVARNAIS